MSEEENSGYSKNEGNYKRDSSPSEPKPSEALSSSNEAHSHPGQNAAQYGQQQSQSAYNTQPSGTPRESANNAAIIALVLGIASWIGCSFITAIPGTIMGRNELKRIENGESSPEGKSLAQVGFWLSAVYLGFFIVALAVGCCGALFLGYLENTRGL